MKLSSPVFKLKRQAKLHARRDNIPLHQALDHVAEAEGFRSWSHLAAQRSTAKPAQHILAHLAPGDMALIGARPGQGKTLLGLELAELAARRGQPGFVFTLDYTKADVLDRYRDLGITPGDLVIDTSDEICADYIIDRLKGRSGQALVVIDYLQILDQKRSTPPLDAQIRALKAHAKAAGCIFVIIAQIDRTFELSGKAMPTLSDIRLPNPLDLSLFDRACFLHGDEMQIETAA